MQNKQINVMLEDHVMYLLFFFLIYFAAFQILAISLIY